MELKSEKQLDLQSLHRVRSRLVNARKTLINQLRAILLERGHIIAQRPRRLDRVRRDNEAASAYCLTVECSRPTLSVASS